MYQCHLHCQIGIFYSRHAISGQDSDHTLSFAKTFILRKSHLYRYIWNLFFILENTLNHLFRVFKTWWKSYMEIGSIIDSTACRMHITRFGMGYCKYTRFNAKRKIILASPVGSESSIFCSSNYFIQTYRLRWDQWIHLMRDYCCLGKYSIILTWFPNSFYFSVIFRTNWDNHNNTIIRVNFGGQKNW